MTTDDAGRPRPGTAGMLRRRRRPGSRVRRLAGLVAGVLLVAGCSLGDDEVAPPAATSTTSRTTGAPSTAPGGEPGAAEGLDPFYDQQVQWEPCAAGFECATVDVPLDYADPGGETIGLAVDRLPATGEARGSLLVNPGGPGASGVDYATQLAGQLGTDVLASYDLVGFDPRGVAGSDPVDCVDTAGTDALIAADPDPDSAAETADVQSLLSDFAAGCVDDGGALARHVSTTEAARDLDVLRAVLGDDKLQYYGASYGTFIGALYAEQFPDRVGRMVLDGAINPRLDLEQLSLVQAEGFETALRAYVDDCVARTACPLGDSLDGGVRRVQQLLADLDAAPLPTSGDRELTEALGLYGIALPLYAPQLWPTLDQALQQAFDGEGSLLLALSDAYWQRTADGYDTNFAEVIYAVNCLDYPNDVTPEQIVDAVPRFEAASPTFGRTFAWSQLACSQWPVEPSVRRPKVDGAGAAPIVVLGTTRDPATPYESSVALADQLDSGVLVTRDGDGHTAYGQDNECIDSTVEAYLVDGDVPAAGTRC